MSIIYVFIEVYFQSKIVLCTVVGDYVNTRLLGHFEPILYFKCKHVLFVYIAKQKFRGFF